MAEKTKPARAVEITPTGIENKIFSIHGYKVMLDADLAELYQTTTKSLNLAVRRNKQRFPEDFMFQLKKEDFENLRFQIATSSWGGRRYLPYVFTEHGAVMLAGILNSPVAIKASIEVVRAFIYFRSILGAHKELARKIAELEKKYDGRFQIVFTAIRKLMGPPVVVSPKRQMGFSASDEKKHKT